MQDNQTWPFRVMVDQDYRPIILGQIFDVLKNHAKEEGIRVSPGGSFPLKGKMAFVFAAEPPVTCDQMKGFLSAALVRTNSKASAIECQDGRICEFKVSGLKPGVS